MFSQFSVIYKRFSRIPRLQGNHNIIQTIFFFRFCSCSSFCPNIPAYTNQLKSSKYCTAEFGSFAQEEQYSVSEKLLFSARRVHTTSKKYKMGSLDSVADVDIDSDGKFKYILIEVEKGDEKKTIVRGYKWAGYHADIYDQVTEQLEAKSFDCECVGGGRIEHKKNEQTLFIYGYSMGFGRANHEITVEKLKAWYPTYKKITYSNEGY